MSRYIISKISVSSTMPDGSPVYEYDLKYDTWREMVNDLHYRDQYANVIFMGRGAHIFCDGELIGHTGDFGKTYGETPINKVSKTMFAKLVAEEF